MELQTEMPLAEIVKRYPAAAALFEKYELDYCCHGKQTLQQACEGDITKYGKVTHALRPIIQDTLPKNNFVHFENMDVSELTDYIIVKHHGYVKEAIPIIHAHLQKIVTKHGTRHPELNKVFELFEEFVIEMQQHMLKEEQVLFPRIQSIDA